MPSAPSSSNRGQSTRIRPRRAPRGVHSGRDRSVQSARSAAKGAAAGALATAAMDTLLYVRYRRSGGTESPLRWEFSANVHGWKDASAPGLVGKRLIEKILGHEAPDKWARPIQNAMHWGTGMGWSAAFGITTGSAARQPWAEGLIFGPVVWLSGYAILPLAKIYQPIWTYDVKTLAKDFSAHLVYGVAAGSALGVLSRGTRN
jgi:hypothetical protein